MQEQVFAALGACFIRGDAAAAMEIMAKQEELQPLYEQYVDIFCRENYIRYDVPDKLNAVLRAYQQYFRDTFYLKCVPEQAEGTLLDRLRELLGAEGDEAAVGQAVETAFRASGFHAQTGRTNGHFGPYIWKTTVPTTYTVELPDGTCEYTVNILKDFVLRSWMAYLTFDLHGTGGWTSPDGRINCVESAYDFESEQFLVSLLKHEAQHVRDLARWPDMPAWLLEYRAKLVELIYTRESGLLQKFVREAVPERTTDSHAVAACKIAEGMGTFVDQPVSRIREKARELFAFSEEYWKNK